jgi:hypothetical protein
MYRIKQYSIRQANKLGVKIRPSTRPGKKIDVYKNGIKVASIGARGYLDYPTYLEKYGATIANTRRKLYHIRHKKNKVPGTPGYYAAKILW